MVSETFLFLFFSLIVMVNSFFLPGFEMLSWSDREERKKFDSLVDKYSYCFKYAYCGKYTIQMKMIKFSKYLDSNGLSS